MPIPSNLQIVELNLETSEELTRFGNSLLHGIGGGSAPKAAVIQIQTGAQKRRGYILPPTHFLDASQDNVSLTVGVKNRLVIPAPPLSARSLKRSADAEDNAPKRLRALPITLEQDVPELSVARELETMKLRQHMAELVESLGPLNSRTKTGRFVMRDGYFKGLAAMYGRWVFNQKTIEGEGPGLDPLLPSTAPVDHHQLPKELVEAGLTHSAAMQVSSTLSKLSSEAAHRLAQIAVSNLATGKVCRVHSANAQVRLNFRGTELSISEDHYRKLCNLWDLNSGRNEDCRDSDIFCVLHRYEILNGASPGFQMALPEEVFDVLQNYWGVNHECFASPLNCYHPRFCSLFKDTDNCFGSRGSFFEFNPKEGSFEANPPFVEDTMTANIKHIIKLLATSDSPLSFVVVVPGWDDESCESYLLTTKSKFLRRQLTFQKRDHYYKNGMQHRMQGSDMYQPSTCSTFVFFLQNDAGAAKWPICQRGVNALRDAFMTQSGARTHQGHKDIISEASKTWYDL